MPTFPAIPEQTTPIQMGDVYFNLHRGVWSVRSRRNGRVQSHSRAVVSLMPCKFVVQKAGRDRAVREGVKNVHAFVRMDSGAISDDVRGWQAYRKGTPGLIRVSYNPTYAGAFYRCDTKEPVYHAAGVVMTAPYDAPPTVWAIL